MSSDIEEQILAIERELYTLPDLTALRRRLVALEQGVGQSWTGVGFQAPPPSGHLLPGCPNPIPDTLNFTSSKYGAFLMVYNVSTSRWEVSATVNYPGGAGAGCPTAVSNVGMLWALEQQTVFRFRYNAISSINQCPKTGAIGSSFTVDSTSSYTRSIVCGPPFHATLTSVGNFLWATPETITITV